MQLLHLSTAVVLTTLSCYGLGWCLEKSKQFSTFVSILTAIMSVIIFVFLMKISLTFALLSLK